MKRAYVRPTMVGERFVANEYVAACGDTEYGKYKFTCHFTSFYYTFIRDYAHSTNNYLY